jgi:thioredoxin
MEITQQELKEKINNGEKVIVDFWAEWCSPCRMMKPIFEKVSTKNPDLQMYTLNVMENQDLAVDLGIRSIPTIKAFNDGKEIYSSVGVLNEGDLNKLTETILQS